MDKEQFLKNAKKPTVVDFWAPWCAPCRITKPILEKLAREYEGQVDFWVFNADQNQQLLQELKIYGIPTIILIQDGKIAGRFTGAKQEEAYRQMFESLASGKPVELPMSAFDRSLRLGVGTAATIFALQSSIWWLLALGILILFTGIYDRCPLWKAITTYFKNINKAT